MGHLSLYTWGTPESNKLKEVEHALDGWKFFTITHNMTFLDRSEFVGTCPACGSGYKYDGICVSCNLKMGSFSLRKGPRENALYNFPDFWDNTNTAVENKPLARGDLWIQES